MLLKKVRVAYPHLFTPRTFEGRTAYEVTLLIPKEDTQTLEEIKTAIAAAFAKKWAAGRPDGARVPVKDGDTLKSEAFNGHWVIDARSHVREDGTGKPGCVLGNIDPNTGVLQLATPDDIRSGDYCNVQVDAFAYDKKGNKGVSFGLNNVQLAMKGDRIGGGADRPEDVFGAIEVAGSPEAAAAGAEGASSPDDFFGTGAAGNPAGF